jgi:hypothetical protein
MKTCTLASSMLSLKSAQVLCNKWRGEGTRTWGLCRNSTSQNASEGGAKRLYPSVAQVESFVLTVTGPFSAYTPSRFPKQKVERPCETEFDNDGNSQ